MRVKTYIAGLAVAWAAGGLVGAAEPAAASDEPPGIRFTPEMARGLARKMVPALKHWELPDDKKDEAAEKIARRLMEMFHTTDGKFQELIQRWIEEQMTDQMEDSPRGNGFMPSHFGKEFGERMLELIPAIKDLFRNVGQDLRPMLPVKQQIKMAAEMMAAKTGIDAFEQTMQKWASGEVADYGNPFDPNDKQVKKDETGQSKELKDARKTAQEQLDKFADNEWDRYLKQFKQFYGLDAPQCATADSVVREFKQRAEQRKRDEAWRTRYFQNRMWLNIFWRVPDGWYHPVQILIEEDQDEATSWLQTLSAEMKARLDTVPTASQRKQADARVEALLKGKGIALEGGTK